MKPSGRTETEPLYFTYPYFDAPDASERATEKNTAQVAIVGAGPIGMAAALTLANEGTRSALFDNKSSFNEGSRAICVARSSYYILERLGAVAPFLEKALGWTTGRSFYRGEQILEFHMPDGPHEKFRPTYTARWHDATATSVIDGFHTSTFQKEATR